MRANNTNSGGIIREGNIPSYYSSYLYIALLEFNRSKGQQTKKKRTPAGSLGPMMQWKKGRKGSIILSCINANHNANAYQ